jgi:hypothetical protein
VPSALWRERAALPAAGKLPSGPAANCTFDGAQSEPEPVYVGETSRLPARVPRAAPCVTCGSPIEFFRAKACLA